ncbi:hypothetical protein KR009_001288 [Drosophila setifemur]|nr:hypothetical protein KR009_001288 [Drosophila setifemur]
MANGNNGSANEAAPAPTTPQRKQEPRSTKQALLLTAAGEAVASSKESKPAPASLGVNDLVADLCLNGRSADYTSVRTTTSSTGSAVAASASTSGAASSSSSSFSFKHFLSSTGTVTAPTSTVTSVDASAALQTSTGARPKVPQSASVSHMHPPDANGSSASSKMKRSPRFSSFDSQASLAEYAACGGGGANSNTGSQHRLRPDLRLDHDDDEDDMAQVRNNRLYDERVDVDIFPSAASNLNAPASGSRYVPRSYSSYDMPPQVPCPMSSPRRRPTGNREQRPNRLVLSAVPKMKLDLPLDGCNGAGGGTSGGAAGLPDFVQDHLPDAWCAGQDAHLSSPPNSPLGAAEAPSGAVGLLPSALASMGVSSAAALPGPSGDPPASSTVKMLPDFLSDGPIIHSSQRLADVAIGLPSSSIDSPPQEAAGPLQLSTMRQENERLQRELQEARVELSAQTRRANDFEQQLLQLSEAARRRDALTTTANTQTTRRLRRQVDQLEAELFVLRSGGVPDGAAGGVPVTTPVSGIGGAANSGNSTSRPSRTHQLAQDLQRAADTAEQNLRQLLNGVENLRQMAANLEQPAQATTSPRSPDLYAESN